MKRIALLILAGISLVACDNRVDDPDPVIPPTPPTLLDGKGVSLRIHVPSKGVSTYAIEDASAVENNIDSIFIDLYQSGSIIHSGKFGGTQLQYPSGIDSIILIDYEVDNITAGQTLTAYVYANKRKPTKLTSPNEVPVPVGTDKSTWFYMSDTCVLLFNTSAYYGEAHIARNVAKLRINIWRGDPYFPSDLIIDYDKIKIQVINATDSTATFAEPKFGETAGIGYFNYAERTAVTRRGSAFDSNDTIMGVVTGNKGGYIDSLYLYENIQADCTVGGTNTQIKITIPTESPTEGNKSMTVTYDLYTALTEYCVRRNHIYTLDITVRAQNLDPLIVLDILPWNDIDVPGDIPGTYLELSTSEITFNSSGRATIDFCSDAQAIYFNYSGFNDQNVPQIGTHITPIGIETPANPVLLPDGFKSGQILLDKQHCGSFSFQLEDLANTFPQFPNVNFSGSICLKAGNIVKCLTFPAVKTYDAHFIVGEPLFFPNENFTKADVEPSAASWMEVSPNRLYYQATPNYSNVSEVPLFLHLDENLTGINRTGSITLQNGSVVKTIHITQLSALPVGPFGYNANSPAKDNIGLYDAGLCMEQRYEFSSMPVWSKPSVLLTNYNTSLFNGFQSHNSVVDYNRYNTIDFDFAQTYFPAVNYCAYKNRGRPANNGQLQPADIKWYLPAQAQLVAMWVFETYYKETTKYPFFNFYRSGDILRNYWSATPNLGTIDGLAELVNFDYGNVGHYYRGVQNWVRCVRDTTPTPSYLRNIVRKSTVGGVDFPSLNFHTEFIPASSETHVSSGSAGHESEAFNKYVYRYLRVAKQDLNGGAQIPWNINACASYSEAPAGGGTGNWRLPTQRELQAIWILQHELRAIMSPAYDFELLSNDYYWSGTEASTTHDAIANIYTNAWTIFGNATTGYPGAGNAPHQLKSYPYRVRCVREMNN